MLQQRPGIVLFLLCACKNSQHRFRPFLFAPWLRWSRYSCLVIGAEYSCRANTLAELAHSESSVTYGAGEAWVQTRSSQTEDSYTDVAIVKYSQLSLVLILP